VSISDEIKKIEWQKHCHDQFEHYPYERLSSSYLLFEKEIYFYKSFSSKGKIWDGIITKNEKLLNVTEFISNNRQLFVAYGANAAPSCLQRKLKTTLQKDPIPVLKAFIENFDAVFVAQLLPIGVIPATLIPSPSTKLSCAVLPLTDEQIELLNASEFIDFAYSLVPIKGSEIFVESGRSPLSILTYIHRERPFLINHSPIALQACSAQQRIFPSIHHKSLLKKVCRDLKINYCDFCSLVYNKSLHKSQNYARILEHFKTFKECPRG
jgi:hypothetical protein